MAVNKERVLKLVQALESGEFVQGRQRLHRVAMLSYEDVYCCLGVACVIAFREGAIDSLPWECDITDGGYSNGSLNIAVRDWYGFDTLNPELLVYSPGSGTRYISATDANDTYRLTFQEIAAAFRRTYLQ